MKRDSQENFDKSGIPLFVYSVNGSVACVTKQIERSSGSIQRDTDTKVQAEERVQRVLTVDQFRSGSSAFIGRPTEEINSIGHVIGKAAYSNDRVDKSKIAVKKCSMEKKKTRASTNPVTSNFKKTQVSVIGYITRYKA